MQCSHGLRGRSFPRRPIDPTHGKMDRQSLHLRSIGVPPPGRCIRANQLVAADGLADAAYAAMRGVADAVGYVGGGIGGTHRRCIVRRWTPKSGAPRMRPDAAGPRRVECIPGIRGLPTTLYEEKVVGGSAECYIRDLTGCARAQDPTRSKALSCRVLRAWAS